MAVVDHTAAERRVVDWLSFHTVVVDLDSRRVAVHRIHHSAQLAQAVDTARSNRMVAVEEGIQVGVKVEAPKRRLRPVSRLMASTRSCCSVDLSE